MALANCMMLSLLKAAHAVMSGAAYREFGSATFFNPCTRKSATWGTRPGGQACEQAFKPQTARDLHRLDGFRLAQQGGTTAGRQYKARAAMGWNE